MNLKDFVTETLEQILEGVSKAKPKYGEGKVAPVLRDGDDDMKTLRTRDGGRSAFLVEFDVALSVTESSQTGAGGGLTVFSVASMKAEKDQKTESSTVSRIKFSVPISFDN